MEKRGLGKGLSALLSENSVNTEGQVQDIPLSQVVANPFQPRTLFDPLKMEDLLTSIKEHGVLQPILVRQIGANKYQLVAGERRFRASQAAGLASIPALIKSVTDQTQLEIAIVENLQREDIGALESARAFRRLIDEFNLTQDSVSKRVGKSRSAVANTLRLLNLPEEIQDSLERNEISEGHARALLMITDKEYLLQAWSSVVKRGLSVRDTEKLARTTRPIVEGEAHTITVSGSGEVAGRVYETKSLKLDPHEASVAEQLQHKLGTKVTLRHFAGGAGRIEIDFFSEEDLFRIVEALLSSM